MQNAHSLPVVLALSGHDPSGGAGIQADIETIQAQGCHPATAITCLTVQDSVRVHALFPVSSDLFLRQSRCVIEDLQPQVIKIGLISSRAIAEAIGELLSDLPGVPVVLDPVLHSGNGRPLSAVEFLQPLLPLCTLITPNRKEARLLSGAEEVEASARALLRLGVDSVLVTGADEAEADQVVNTLYDTRQTRHWRWPRLPGSYHGSGCTLASAVAARLALGETLTRAVEQAQQYTFDSIEKSCRLGQGQQLPRRIVI